MQCTSSGQCVSTNNCGDATKEGKCHENVLHFCNETGTVEEVNCSKNNHICSPKLKANGNIWMDCQSCDVVGDNGTCQGNVHWFCDYGNVQSDNCSESDSQCMNVTGTNEEPYYQCVTEASPCDTIPDQGTCDGNILVECGTTGLVETNCEDEDKKCWIISWPAPNPACVNKFAAFCGASYCHENLLVSCIGGNSMTLKDCAKEGKECESNSFNPSKPPACEE
jgi:hypothetical protein